MGVFQGSKDDHQGIGPYVPSAVQFFSAVWMRPPGQHLLAASECKL